MDRYYDQTRNCLVYVGHKATEEFWDARWRSDDFLSLIEVSARRNKFFVNYTRKYLPTGSRILEGGCGRGDKVHSLQASGFDVYGVDYAPDTVRNINRYAPGLKVSLGDVRHLDFPNGFFDGYWSIGVIEHFYDGYEPIQSEMSRVLRRGGYLFLSVPAMSWLRVRKASLQYYPVCQENETFRKEFYQFALDPDRVIDSFQEQGFLLEEVRLRNGFMGMQDELKWAPFQQIMKKIDRGQGVIVKKFRKVIDILTTPYANHSVLFVLRRI